MSPQIFIAGATARSAAQSARRAGLEVAAADLFGDRDLAACGTVQRVRDYPGGIVSIARQVSSRKWMYTGGLENAPDVVGAVSQYHDLLGNPPCILEQVRDPWSVQHALEQAGLDFPPVRNEPPAIGTGRWLQKPRRSGGGMHISDWRDAKPVIPGHVTGPGSGPGGGSYYQEHVCGGSYGAVYVAAAGSVRFLGATRQLVGCRWAGARGYRYVGSVGPVPLRPSLTTQFERIGRCLTRAFGLCGIFGVDTIVTGKHVWTVEVNPRFTASVEIHERATGWCAVEAHWRACQDGTLPDMPPLDPGVLHGKAVVYARRAGEIGESYCGWIDRQNMRQQLASFADLPQVGTRIAAGAPVLTVLAQGERTTDVYHQLRAQARSVYQAMDGQ